MDGNWGAGFFSLSIMGFYQCNVSDSLCPKTSKKYGHQVAINHTKLSVNLHKTFATGA